MIADKIIGQKKTGQENEKRKSHLKIYPTVLTFL